MGYELLLVKSQDRFKSATTIGLPILPLDLLSPIIKTRGLTTHRGT